MAISFNSLFSPFLFMLLRRLGPAYSDHLHYPKQICFEVLRFCKKKEPLIPHEKMFKAHKFTGTDVHYHWICLPPPLFAPLLVIDYLMSFSSFSVQHLPFTEASTLLCQSTLQSFLPICWKQSTEDILWQPLISPYLSRYHCVLPVVSQRWGLILSKKTIPCNPCLPTTQI